MLISPSLYIFFSYFFAKKIWGEGGGQVIVSFLFLSPWQKCLVLFSLNVFFFRFLWSCYEFIFFFFSESSFSDLGKLLEIIVFIFRLFLWCVSAVYRVGEAYIYIYILFCFRFHMVLTECSHHPLQLQLNKYKIYS